MSCPHFLLGFLGVSVQLTLWPLVQGEKIQSTARSDLVGPVDGKEYTYRDEFDLVSTNQAPCGVSTVLNINSDVRVSNSQNTKGQGYIATDSINTGLTTVSVPFLSLA